jgi:hypothetical protein
MSCQRNKHQAIHEGPCGFWPIYVSTPDFFRTTHPKYYMDAGGWVFKKYFDVQIRESHVRVQVKEWDWRILARYLYRFIILNFGQIVARCYFLFTVGFPLCPKKPGSEGNLPVTRNLASNLFCCARGINIKQYTKGHAVFGPFTFLPLIFLGLHIP